MNKTRKTGNSRSRILLVAEELFAEQGFDGARMDEIARRAGVNKALIYYYFKSKEDVLDALFVEAMEEIIGVFEDVYEDLKLEEQEVNRLFNVMFKLIDKKRSIIKIMLMESLKKSTGEKPPLFKIGDFLISGEVGTIIEMMEKRGLNVAEKDKRQMLVTEFFTGMMPLLALAVFQDDWCRYYGMDKPELKDRFFRAFKMTHFAYHQAMMQ